MPSECLKEGHCKALQTSFFECKRSMVSLGSDVIFIQRFIKDLKQNQLELL